MNTNKHEIQIAKSAEIYAKLSELEKCECRLNLIGHREIEVRYHDGKMHFEDFVCISNGYAADDKYYGTVLQETVYNKREIELFHELYANDCDPSEAFFVPVNYGKMLKEVKTGIKIANPYYEYDEKIADEDIAAESKRTVDAYIAKRECR